MHCEKLHAKKYKNVGLTLFHFLALAESPELPEISVPSDVVDDDVPQHSDEEDCISTVTGVPADDAETVTDEPSVTMRTTQQTDDITQLMEEATPRLLDSYEEDEVTAQK